MASIATIAAIRFGVGLSTRHSRPTGADDLLADLAAPDDLAQAYPVARMDEALVLVRNYEVARKAARAKTEGSLEEFNAARRAVRAEARQGLAVTFARGMEARTGFRDRLTLFWMNHFTARARAPQHRAAEPAYINTAIRPHVTGRFADMLIAVATNPLMLAYLDQIRSTGPNSPFGRKRGIGLNENLAREVLELHTLGVDGGYSQGDVRQFAELLTGLSFAPKKGFVFRPGMAEPGAETVLGRTYGGTRPDLADITAALEDLARHPATAAHICGKIARHFLADSPDSGVVDRMAKTWMQTDGALMPVYSAMLDHPAAWRDFGAKVRQPIDFILASLRALGVPGDAVMQAHPKTMRDVIVHPLNMMGQPWMAPPAPDGWPEEAENWVTPQGLAARVNWSMYAPRRIYGVLPDPREFVKTALADAADPPLVFAAGAAETRVEGLGIVLSSPAFNRR